MEQKFILYPRQDGGVVLVAPCDCGLTVEEIARKDVPAGLPYLILSRSELPADATYADAWVADFSQPHGTGIGPEAWWAEQAQKQQEGEDDAAGNG